MKLAIAGQDAHGSFAARDGGEQPDQKLMGVGREDDRVGHRRAQLFGDIGLRLGPDLVHDPVPLAVGEPRRILPAFDLAFEAGVRPQMMAVRGDVQPLGIGAEAAREERLETQSSVLSDQSSGNARFSSVERR